MIEKLLSAEAAKNRLNRYVGAYGGMFWNLYSKHNGFL